MKIKLENYAPPGFDLTAEIFIYICGMAASALFSSSFLWKVYEAKRSLYEIKNGRYSLIPGAVMPDFVELLDFSLIGFGILALCMLAFIIFHYSYYYQGTKNIYLMRRLPDKFEYHRRTLTLPILAAFSCLAAAFILLLFYFVVYLQTTPESCLTPDQWQKIWRELL